MQCGVVEGTDIAAREDVFEVLKKCRVDGHDILEVAVDGAILDHQYFAIALDDLSFDFAGLAGVEDFEGRLAVEDLLADLGDAARAERIGRERPAEWSFGFLPGLEQGFIGPVRNEAGVAADGIELVEDYPGGAGGVCQSFRSEEHTSELQSPC